MISQLKTVLDNYALSKASALTSSDICYKLICNDIPNEIANFLGDEKRYLTQGSVGVGNWASVPWIAIFDKLVTTSAQNGYYPVFLLKDDMTGVYFSLGVGVTSIIQEFRTKRKIEEALRLQTSNILARIERVPEGFKSNIQSPIKIRSSAHNNNSLLKLSSNDS